VENNEKSKKKWINTSSSEFKKITENTFYNKPNEFKKFLKKINTNYLEVSTDKDYLKDLIKLFRQRKNNR
jgi:vacuolar-type H+-ATPase subunit C/Vma6